MQWNATGKFMDISEQWTTKLSPLLQLAIVASLRKYTMLRLLNYTRTAYCIQNRVKIKDYFFTSENTKDYEKFTKRSGSDLRSAEYTNRPYWHPKDFCRDAVEVLFGRQCPLSATAFQNSTKKAPDVLQRTVAHLDELLPLTCSVLEVLGRSVEHWQRWHQHTFSWYCSPSLYGRCYTACLHSSFMAGVTRRACTVALWPVLHGVPAQ